ncbi:hypothetical protein [Pyrofollis japonicus]|uniref:hypothetical protein n=1 Tax=Pyrofollis japonicus TaxID=3060460 RepID=UPI00295BC1A3|nr:hypothetical protein [Pyrofollis japonicus]
MDLLKAMGAVPPALGVLLSMHASAKASLSRDGRRLLIIAATCSQLSSSNPVP